MFLNMSGSKGFEAFDERTLGLTSSLPYISAGLPGRWVRGHGRPAPHNANRLLCCVSLKKEEKEEEI